MRGEWPREGLVFFLDRNLGKHIIPDRLRSEGMKVEVHDDHLRPDAPDEDWIALVGRMGWVAFTKDKNIRHRKAEIESIRRNSARIIVIRAKNTIGAEIAEILVKGRRRIERFVRKTPAPFVAAIYRNSKIEELPNINVRLERDPSV
ncbi:MAG: hypothetical protein OXG96_07930 [Acidobacteria bacterium]|nr:hypothetical protein [Acidobacteriota bacterium]